MKLQDSSLLFTLSHCVHIRVIPETTARCISGPACAGINSLSILLVSQCGWNKEEAGSTCSTLYSTNWKLYTDSD